MIVPLEGEYNKGIKDELLQVFVFIYLGKMLGSSQRIFCPPSRSKAKIKLEGLKNTLRVELFYSEYGPLNTPGSCTKHKPFLSPVRN